MTRSDGTLYVFHFEPPYRWAGHYIGIALDNDVQRRLAEHLAGHGSPLIRAAVAAGCRVHLVAEMPGDRRRERQLHNMHGPRVCPRCRSQRPPRPRQILMFRQPAPHPRGGPSLLWRLAHAA